MIQIRSLPAGVQNRSLGRGRRLFGSRPNASIEVPVDWRRSLVLLRRLLAGELGIVGDVTRKESDTRPTLAVLVFGVLFASVGGWLWLVIDTGGAAVANPALKVLLLGSLVSLGGWALWLVITWQALRAIFEVNVDLGALMRSMALVGGFAAWQVFMFVGPASFAVGLIVTIASVMLTVIAVRAAAPDADDRAAIVSVGIGFGIYALALSLLADLAGVGSGLFVHAIR
ncbi:MAG: hypothetical protein OXG27_06015 [Chloroflexi bacterium]|nr:hypothetical protein [Chloroflexota bacterium]